MNTPMNTSMENNDLIYQLIYALKSPLLYPQTYAWLDRWICAWIHQCLMTKRITVVRSGDLAEGAIHGHANHLEPVVDVPSAAKI
jgi:hypothetical protein